MSTTDKRTHELRNRILYTLLILAIYLAGRNLILYGVDVNYYNDSVPDIQNLIFTMVMGDRNQYTFFALGIMPGITASLIVQFVTAFSRSEKKLRMSKKRNERITFVLMLIISFGTAVSRAGKLVFREDIPLADYTMEMAVVCMFAGAILIYHIAEQNKKHGIGGQSALIFLNIADGLVRALRGKNPDELMLPGILCGIMIVVTLVMEYVMVKIPVQRVSIHNEYAKKSYIAFKLSPIGVMPVMFATMVFMLPQIIFGFLAAYWSDNALLQTIYNNLDLTKPVGVIVYLAIIVLLTILFSFVMLNPGDIAEQLQKSGDSIVGVYAGKPTSRYIRRIMLALSLLSGCVLAAGMGVSMFLAIAGEISADLAMLPSSVMIFVGIVCSLCHEIKVYRKFDKYRFFI